MGFPESWFVDREAVSKKLECPICLEVLKDAVFHLDCQNGFCRACLANVRACPLCRQKLDGSLRTDRTRNDLVGDLQVYCTHRGTDVHSGCVWSGPLHALAHHESAQCEFNFVMCRECNERLLARDLARHAAATCALRLVTCEHCQQRHRAISSHFAHCKEQPTRCMNATLGCAAVVPRRLLRQHAMTECLYSYIPCRNSQFGCAMQVTRGSMPAHLLVCPGRAEAEAARAVVEASERSQQQRANLLREQEEREKRQLEASPAFNRPQKCRRCNQRFVPAHNTPTCFLHETKPRREKREKQTWLPFFRHDVVVCVWPCCGRVGAKATGCTAGYHVPSKPVITPAKEYLRAPAGRAAA